MALFSATTSGLLRGDERALFQVSFYADFLLSSARIRVHSWDLSFQGIVAGNTLDVSVHSVADTEPGGGEIEFAKILSGDNKFTQIAPYILPGGGSVTPSPALDRVHAVDTSFIRKQYARGREPVVDTYHSFEFRCTPSNLFTPVPWKANVIFSA